MSHPQERTSYKVRAGFQMKLMAAWRLMRRDRFKSGQFEIVKLQVRVAGLDPTFAGYRILQITDLHMGHWITAPRLMGVVDLAKQEKPDLVVLTGDFVSYVVDEIADDLSDGLSRLQATDGVLAILGNHDHWMGADRISQILTNAGVRVLRNEVFEIIRPPALARGREMDQTVSLYIAGLDDVMVGADDLPAILEQLPSDAPAILLAHEPDFADLAAESGRFALQLSGHSHGGQIVLPGFGPLFRGPGFWKYPIGRYQVGDMVQYTNRGIGTHVLRLRINCAPEITVISLE